MSAIAKVLSVAPVGFSGYIVEVEGDSAKGLPSLQIVGLGNKAIDEARERVRSAITNSMLDYPTKRITINLAPAELPKDGTHYDLPIALAILISSNQVTQSEVLNAVFAGELALDGTLRPVRGAITIAETARDRGYKKIYIPIDNIPQASLIEGIEIIGVACLKDLFLILKQEMAAPITPQKKLTPTASVKPITTLDDIYGQEQAKRALIIAAAGRHNILLTGPPGAGKTMLARALSALLPPLSKAEQVTLTKLYSLAGESTSEVVGSRPFRSPHHTASRIALIGGGTSPSPGEISLAHLGVLFLDEIPEYPRATIEALRQPLEDKIVSISRSGGRATYPADFVLVATMNPCPCGYYGDPTRECSCSSSQIVNYQKRVSGPLLDRIDMIVPMARVSTKLFLESSTSKSQHLSAVSQIISAKNIQSNRYKSSVKYNGTITNKDIKSSIRFADGAMELLSSAADKLDLSARKYFKMIKIAATIADLEQSGQVTKYHISEALQYR